jgi:hypothetical protein
MLDVLWKNVYLEEKLFLEEDGKQSTVKQVFIVRVSSRVFSSNVINARKN